VEVCQTWRSRISSSEGYCSHRSFLVGHGLGGIILHDNTLKLQPQKALDKDGAMAIDNPFDRTHSMMSVTAINHALHGSGNDCNGSIGESAGKTAEQCAAIRALCTGTNLD